MFDIQDEVVFPSLGYDTRHSEDSASSLPDPLVSKSTRDHHIFRIPAFQGLTIHALDRHGARDIDTHYLVVLRWLRQVGVDQNFKKGPGVRFRSINGTESNGVPSRPE